MYYKMFVSALIMLKVALNTIKPTNQLIILYRVLPVLISIADMLIVPSL